MLVYLTLVNIMYDKYTRLSKEYGFEYQETVWENHSDWSNKSKLHPYFTGRWATGEPFPCPVPLFANIQEVKDLAQEQDGLMQPIFYCENVKAAVMAFWCIKSIDTNQNIRFAKYPVTASPSYESRNAKTKLELKDKNNQQSPRWYKLDPISIKMNPWSVVTQIVSLPPSTPDGIWETDTVTRRYHSLGDYMTKGEITNAYIDQGYLSIYGVVKTDDGQYAIIGGANLQEFESSGSDGIIGYPPGTANLGEKSIAQTTHTSKMSTIIWGHGITSKFWQGDYTGQHRIPNTYPAKYVTVRNSYTSFSAVLQFETQKASPFFS